MSSATLEMPSSDVEFHAVEAVSPPTEKNNSASSILARAKKRNAEILRNNDNPAAIGEMSCALLQSKHSKDIKITEGRSFSASIAHIKLKDLITDDDSVVNNYRHIAAAEGVGKGDFSMLVGQDDKTTLKMVSGGRNETAEPEICEQVQRDYLRQFGLGE